VSRRKRVERQKFGQQEVLRLARTAYFENPTFDVRPEKAALLVIDMQYEFVKPSWTPFWVPQATRIVKRVRSLIDDCKRREIPIIFTVYARTHSRLDRPKSGAFMPNRYTGKIPDDPAHFRDGKIDLART